MIDLLQSDDLLVRILASFCDVRAVVATLRTCKSLRERICGGSAHARVLWRHLHLRRWPAAALLRLQDRHLRAAAALAASPQPLRRPAAPVCHCYYCIFNIAGQKSNSNHIKSALTCYSWERYRRRVFARRRDLQLCDGIYTLRGSSTDTRNGNITPASATVRVTASTNLGFAGNVIIGRGTIHNNSTEGTWRGHFGADAGGPSRSVYCCTEMRERASGSTSRWRLFFEERLPTNRGCFDYAGTVNMGSGTRIEGTFKWSMMARRDRGTFAMEVVSRDDEAAED